MKRYQANHDLQEAGTRREDLVAAEGRLLEAQGKLREVEVALREAVVRAPEPAVVEVLAVRKGDLVQPNQTILRILRADDLWVKVYVPETQLGKVRLGQAVEIAHRRLPRQAFRRQGDADRGDERIHAPKRARARTNAGTRCSASRSGSRTPTGCSSRAWRRKSLLPLP